MVAFGTAADELAHLLADDHVREGIIGFCFATFAVSWAWINFSWFASAYDTDDWVYRLTTMVQMAGVLVLALGLKDMFASLVEGDHLDNSIMVLGYVIMRVPMIGQWLRAAHQDPERREVCKIFVVTLVVSQLGWIGLLFLDLGDRRDLRLHHRAGPDRAGGSVRRRARPRRHARGTRTTSPSATG